MKIKYIIIFILFILFIRIILNEGVNAQWIQQYPVTGSNHLYDVHFVNDKTGWTCGNQGRIMRTTNGGNNWITQKSGVPGEILNRIFAVDSQVVYCTGYFETILKTTNGGDNWIIIRHSPEQAPSFFGLFFIDRNTGWLAKDRYILKTTDGCKSFDSAYLPYVRHNFDINFRNYDEGLACGEGAMSRTTDGGLSWFEINIFPGFKLDDFFRLTFVNSNTGYTQGTFGNQVYKTINFGLTWDSVSTVWGADDSYCIFFSSENTGYSAGSFGRMFKTTNGGYNWAQQDMSQFNTGFINDLWFYNDNIGWAVGSATKILYTSTGGTTFIAPISSEVPESFKLYQNYPNPFNPNTTIEFDIKSNGNYKMEIFDVTGRKVDEILNEYLITGSYRITYDADKLTSGAYFYKLSKGEENLIKKFILTK